MIRKTNEATLPPYQDLPTHLHIFLRRQSVCGALGLHFSYNNNNDTDGDDDDDDDDNNNYDNDDDNDHDNNN